MKTIRIDFKILVILLALMPWGICHSAELILDNTPVQVYFSPNGGCTDGIIKEIDNAKTEILLQAYSFTSKSIAKALIEAQKRGVKVEAILDKSQKTQNYSGATFLANSRIPTFIDSVHAIAHDKTIIIDGKTIITGSFNFTKAAEEKNSENLLILNSDELAKLYIGSL
jgi:phosphatidylserine/phosphatidylglycerophosphate/cardiolipin synthase-like enzyme